MTDARTQAAAEIMKASARTDWTQVAERALKAADQAVAKDDAKYDRSLMGTAHAAYDAFRSHLMATGLGVQMRPNTWEDLHHDTQAAWMMAAGAMLGRMRVTF